MSGVLMQIQISTDGSIKVVDAEGKALYPLNPEEFSAKLPGKTIKMAELCSILYTNPCAWVYVNGQSYYRCDQTRAEIRHPGKGLAADQILVAH